MRKILFGLLLAFSFSSHALTTNEFTELLLCDKSLDDVAVCSFRGASADSPKPKVLYYFHGIRRSPDLTAKPVAAILSYSQRLLRGNMPTVVALSTGPEGIFRENNVASVEKAMDEFEAKTFNGVTPERHLIGASMGGYNSLRLLMEHPERYKSSTLLCPAILDISSYDPSEKTNYVARHAGELNKPFFDYAWNVFETNFPTYEEWNKNNPLVALRDGRFKKISFFVSTGRQDSLGFYEGSQKWVDAAVAQGIDIRWAPVEGPHCSFDKSALIYSLYSKFR